MNTLLIRIQDKRWQKALPHLRMIARKAVGSILDLTRTEVSILLTDDSFIRELNKTHRGIDKPTNVLSFPMPDMGLPVWQAGDMVLSYETMEREAIEQHKTLEEHFAHLLIHSALHLLGYDHILEKDAEEMENIEIQKLKGLGYQNPYQNETFR